MGVRSTTEKTIRSCHSASQEDLHTHYAAPKEPAINNIRDVTHPPSAQTVLPASIWQMLYHSMWCHETRLSPSFFPQAIRLIDTLENIPWTCFTEIQIYQRQAAYNFFLWNLLYAECIRLSTVMYNACVGLFVISVYILYPRVWLCVICACVSLSVRRFSLKLHIGVWWSTNSM